jgi:hypothetical protein
MYRRYLVFMFMVVSILVFPSCDLLPSTRNIFEGMDGRIVVHTANPLPDDIGDEGFTFLVNIDLPDSTKKYGIFISPEKFSTSSVPPGAPIYGWCHPSPMYPSVCDNIEAGGWIGYRNSSNVFVKLTKGTVEKWELNVNIWDSINEKYVAYYNGYFDYLVSVK